MSIETESQTEGGEEGEDEDGSSPVFLATVGVCALILGGIAGFAASNVGVFAVVAAGGLVTVLTGYHLSNKEIPTEVMGTTSYIAAVLLLFLPFALYIPQVTLGGQEIQFGMEEVTVEEGTIGGDSLFDFSTFTATGLTGVDNILGLVVWTVVLMVVALILLIVGKVLKTMASDKKRENRRPS